MSTNELIASANTSRGFAIGIVKTTWKSTCYEVVRMNRRSQYIVITRHDDEASARKSANAEWKADMAASRKAA